MGKTPSYRPQWTSEIKHTEICIKTRAAYAEYVAKYPNYCKACNGTSILVEAPTQWEPGGEEPCGVCVLEGKCPRCGSDKLSSIELGKRGESGYIEWYDDYHCKACGWNGEDKQGCPESDCYCWHLDKLGEAC